MEKLKCNKCGYEWYPRRPELPISCPSCKSREWNKDKKKEK